MPMILFSFFIFVFPCPNLSASVKSLVYPKKYSAKFAPPQTLLPLHCHRNRTPPPLFIPLYHNRRSGPVLPRSILKQFVCSFRYLLPLPAQRVARDSFRLFFFFSALQNFPTCLSIKKEKRPGFLLTRDRGNYSSILEHVLVISLQPN